MKFETTVQLCAWLMLAAPAWGDDVTVLRADRAAIERIYYNHRTGAKAPFEQTLPPAVLENLVRQDLLKQATLKQAYGVAITPAMLEAEVRRINTSTRAPDVLAEIKAALGHDPVRFANVFAKPMLVERLLREKFTFDNSLHAGRREQAGQMRSELLAAKQAGASYDQLLAHLQRRHSNAVVETTWQLGPRPAEKNAPAAEEIKKRFGPNAQILSPPPSGGKGPTFYLEDLPLELQKVLLAQLRRPGDVSAVIELPGGFLLYVAREKTGTQLRVAGLSLPKRSYEEWLATQSKGTP